MVSIQLSRRLLVGILTGVVVIVGAIIILTQLGLFSTGPTEPIDLVPQEPDVVIRTEMATLEDERSQRLIEASVNALPGRENVTYQALFERVNASTPLAIEEVETVVAFGRYPNSTATVAAAATGNLSRTHVGAIIEANWTRTELKAYSKQESYGNRTRVRYRQALLFKPEDPGGLWVGAIADDTFLIGSESAVKAVADVHASAEPAWDGELRETYRSASDGDATVIMRTPRQLLNQTAPLLTRYTVVSPEHLERVTTISVISGVYYTNGSDIGVEVSIRTASPEEAKDVSALARSAQIYGRHLAANESVRRLLNESVRIEQRDRQVHVTVEDSLENIQKAIVGAGW